MFFGCFRKDLHGTLRGTDYLGRPARTCPGRLAAGELERVRHAREVKAGLWRPDSVQDDNRVHAGLALTLARPAELLWRRGGRGWAFWWPHLCTSRQDSVGQNDSVAWSSTLCTTT